MLLINKPDFTLVSDRRLVKAADVATVRTVEEVIAAAEADAARIREEAKAAFEEEKKRGYEKGLKDGKLEIAMQKLEQLDQSVAFMESVEVKMADVVMKALKSCVMEIGDKEMVVNIVRKTMNAVIRTQRHVTLKVAPEMVSAVKERVEALRMEYPTVETFDVVEDPRLKGPACILETEAGVADASVETQLEAIERSMARHLSGKSVQTGDSGKGAGA
jgi:type III secretion protein L